MNASLPIEAGTKPRRPIAAARASLAVGFALLAFGAVHFLLIASRVLTWPFERDYGEGIVWQQMRWMFEGKGYGPIDGFPTIVFHYPPLYHATVQALAMAGMDALFAGRLVTLLATFASVALVGMIATRISATPGNRAAAAIAGIFVGVVVLDQAVVHTWAIVMRVDMLAIALSLLGLWFGLLAVTRPAWVTAASLCFVAAIFTKQTSVAAPAAVFAVLLLINPRTAVKGIAICVGLGSAILLALEVATNGGFLRHLVLYNINRFDLRALRLIPAAIVIYFLFFAAAAIGLTQILRERLPAYRGLSLKEQRRKLAARPEDAGLLAVLIYLVAKTLMVILIAKSGASTNYLLEWMLACAIFIGPIVRNVALVAGGGTDTRGSRRDLLVPPALGLLAMSIALAPTVMPSERWLAQFDRLSAMVRASDRPIISDEMVLLLRNGKEVVWEPAIFAELASTGHWDERPFVARIRAGQFGFFVTEGDHGGNEFQARYTPAVAAAMDTAYPTHCRLAGYVLHLPAREHCPAL